MAPSSLELLLHRLDLQPESGVGSPEGGELVWTGSAGEGSLNRQQRLFGGLITAQVVVAAGRTMPDRRVHSLQQVFLRPGSVADPLRYRVRPLFEGGVHAALLVAVEQQGEVISHAQIGMTRGRTGQMDFDRSVDWGPEPPPEATDREVLRSNLQPGHTAPIEMRVMEDVQLNTAPALDLWFRSGGSPDDDPGDDPVLHAAMLGYVSDRGVLSTASKMLGEPPKMQSSTVNHNLWIHRPIDMRDWHLHRVTVQSMTDGRALLDGAIHRPDGTLVASTRQEGAVRLRQ